MWKQVKALENYTNASSNRSGIEAGNRYIGAIQPDTAFIDRLKQIQTAQQGRFSGTGGTDKAQHFACDYLQIDLIADSYTGKPFG